MKLAPAVFQRAHQIRNIELICCFVFHFGHTRGRASANGHLLRAYGATGVRRAALNPGRHSFLPDGAGGTTFEHLRCEDNEVVGCGSYGIRFEAGVYTYAKVNRNKVRNPGVKFASPGRSAFRWDASVTWVGQQIEDNDAINDGTGFMSYGFENVSSANVQSTLIADNHTRNHVTVGYLTLQHATNTRRHNRMGDSSLHGSFTTTAAATKAVTNSNAQAGMRISIFPTNAAAVALQAGTDALYWDGTVTAGTDFTLKTGAGGNMAGTETFDYQIDV